MHPEALRGVQWGVQASGMWVERATPNLPPLTCIDVGGADVNGTARRVVDSGACRRGVNVWTGADIEDGPGVDMIMDARKPPDPHMIDRYDVVLCTEVFEHVQDWSSIVITIHELLKPGGVALMTCASTGRRPHGARGAMDPAPGEWYGNVAEESLQHGIELAGFLDYATRYNPMPGDAYAWARKAS